MKTNIRKQFGTYVSFLKDNKQVVYALFLIVLIPIILAINTFYVVNAMGKNMDYELRLKAELAGSVTATYSADYLEDADKLQVKVEQVKEQSLYDAVYLVEVLLPEGEDFKVLASTDVQRIGEVMPQWHYAFAWHEEESVASLIETFDPQAGKVWRVVTPIMDESGAKLGLVDIGVSTGHIDQETQNILLRSLIVLVVSIVVVLLLIMNNARLFEYSLLFHKLKEVDAMKDEFISIASHELKAPLNAAKGFLSLIKMEFDDDEKLQGQIGEDVEKTGQCLDRLSMLVADLLDVSRIEQQRLQLEIEEVNIMKVIRAVVDQMEYEAEAKGLDLVINQPDSPPPILKVDKSKLRQIILNLVSNAIKYTMDGYVEIRVKHDDTNLSIGVKDTGIGMSSVQRSRLFQKFYRVQNKKAMHVTGTGLGLWIAKELTNMMGGEIYVDSIEDVGSKFTMTFPFKTLNKKK